MAGARLSKPMKFLLIVFIAIVALYGIAAVVIRYAYPPEKIKAMIIPEVEKVVGRKIGVEDASLSIFPFIGVRLGGVEIAETDRAGFPSENPFVSMDDFRVHVALMPLLQKEVKIVKIAIHKPAIRVLIDSEGSYNYDDLAQSEKKSLQKEKRTKQTRLPMLPIPVTLEKLRIVDGSVFYHDLKSGNSVNLGSIGQDISFSIDKELKDIRSSGRLDISDIALSSPLLTDTLSDLTFSFDHDIQADIPGQKISVKGIELSLQKIKIKAQGTATKVLSANPVLDLRVTADTIQLDDLLKEIPSEISPHLARAEGEGTVFFDLAVKGALPDSGLPAVSGTLSFSDGRIAYTDLPQEITDINAAIQFTDTSLNVQSLKLKAGENPIDMRVAVTNFEQPFVDGEVNARVDLDMLKKVVTLPQGVSASGQVDANVKAKGKADPANPAGLNVEGDVEFKNVVAKTPDIAKAVTVNGTLALTSQTLTPKLAVSLGKSDMQLSAELKDYLTLVLTDSTKKQPRPNLSFTLNSSYLNTDEFLPAGSSQADTGSNDNAPKQPTLLIPAPLPGIDMHGKIKADRLIYSGIEMSNIAMDIDAVDDVMNTKFRAGMYGGSIDNSLRMDIRNHKNLKVWTALKMNGVDVNSTISNVNDLLPDDQQLFTILKDMDDVMYGKAQSDMDFSTNGATVEQLTANLTGKIYTKLSDGRIAGGALLEEVSKTLNRFYEIDEISFRDMRIRARVAQQNVYLDSVRIESPTGDWEADGSVGFDTRADLDISNRLPVAASKKVTAAEQSIKKSGAGLLKNFLGDDAAAAVGQLAQSFAVPTDRDGRVTVLLHMGGTVTSPRVGFRGFGSGNGAAESQPAPKPSARQKVEKKIEEKKQEAQKELEAQKKRLEEEARKKMEKEKRQVQEKQKEVQQDIEKKAKDALKKLF